MKTLAILIFYLFPTQEYNQVWNIVQHPINSTWQAKADQQAENIMQVYIKGGDVAIDRYLDLMPTYWYVSVDVYASTNWYQLLETIENDTNAGYKDAKAVTISVKHEQSRWVVVIFNY